MLDSRDMKKPVNARIGIDGFFIFLNVSINRYCKGLRGSFWSLIAAS